MGLVNWFKANTVDSLNELQKIRLSITGIKNDISEMNKRLNGTTNKVRLRANIITAEEATAQMEAKIQAAMPEELTEVFEKIQKAIDDNRNYIVISKYKIHEEHQKNGAKFSSISQNPCLEDLEQELKKYHYETDLTGTGLIVSWPKKGKAPVIDPDKKYILPMERTTTSDYMRNYAYYNTGHWLVSGGALDDDWAERSGYTVYGKDILSAPNWVKAIKPIEVKE
ncbi:hypothetical protein [Limosilactobacillus reuteri]|uniref:hypothetical protein n=1 Tax=Limosilactobacillus reuteri TaxID=1598 RepID=UPI001C5B249A|nr:hypothetical protein [Limosilactobacillus reuteri]MBW3350679.1 hypothetical protein [Limosilactobacillus reuteri]UUW69721.1 hypothetical protein NUJ10_11830 [Limosilactobacillus reuteri]